MTTYYPLWHGMVESFHRTLKTTLMYIPHVSWLNLQLTVLLSFRDAFRNTSQNTSWIFRFRRVPGFEFLWFVKYLHRYVLANKPISLSCILRRRNPRTRVYILVALDRLSAQRTYATQLNRRTEMRIFLLAICHSVERGISQSLKSVSRWNKRAMRRSLFAVRTHPFSVYSNLTMTLYT